MLLHTGAGVRLFGFLGAGATLGQLFGSLAATVAGRLASARVGGDAAASAMQLSLLLGAAALMETAGRLAGGVKRPAVTDRKSRSPERARAEEGRATVKVSACVPVNIDAGLISSLATDICTAVEHGSHSFAEVAFCVLRWKHHEIAAPYVAVLYRARPSWLTPWSLAQDAPSRSKHAAMPAASAVRRLDSFRLIVASPYLRHLCAFLTLNYVVSSFFYFERSLVVAAAANDSVGRTRLFAAMNSASGAIIAVLQVSQLAASPQCASARVLHHCAAGAASKLVKIRHSRSCALNSTEAQSP